MLNLFLANACESSDLGQVGHIAVHVTIHLDVLHDLLAVGFQAAVEVVQVVDAAHASRGSVEQLSGYGLAERVITFLFPATHEIITILGNHAVELRNLVRTILEVGIHCDDHITLSLFKTSVQCG